MPEGCLRWTRRRYDVGRNENAKDGNVYSRYEQGGSPFQLANCLLCLGYDLSVMLVELYPGSARPLPIVCHENMMGLGQAQSFQHR